MEILQTYNDTVTRSIQPNARTYTIFVNVLTAHDEEVYWHIKANSLLGPVQQLRFQNRPCQITAKLDPNLAKRAYSKLDLQFWRAPVLKPELLYGPYFL